MEPKIEGQDGKPIICFGVDWDVQDIARFIDEAFGYRQVYWCGEEKYWDLKSKGYAEIGGLFWDHKNYPRMYALMTKTGRRF